MNVRRDDDLVKALSLASSLALPTGSTEVAQGNVSSGGSVPGADVVTLTVETAVPG